MRKNLRDVFLIIFITALIIGGYFLVDFIIEKVNHKDFVTTAQELYKSALESKTVDNNYFDSKSNKLEDTNLNYHIEFDNSGNITYFLVYDDKNVIEVEGDKVTEKEIGLDSNYGDMTNLELSQSVNYKHYSLEKSYTASESEYNNVIPDEDELPIMPDNPTTPETPSTPTNPETPSTPTTPETPSTSTTPETPSTPTKPTTPETPSTPTNPSTPDTSELPSKPTNPTKPNLPEIVETKDPITYTTSKSQYCKNTSTMGHTENYSGDEYVYTVSMGQVPNGCYSVEITKIEIDDNENATLYVKNNYPTINKMCTQAIAYPCATATFSRKPNSIKVVESRSEVEFPIYGQDEIEENVNEGTISYIIGESKVCKDIDIPGYIITKNGKSATVNIGAGKKNTGGYSVKIKSVKIDSSNNVTIKAITSKPGKGEYVTQAITYPCASLNFIGEPTSVNVYLDENKLEVVNTK